MRPHYGNYTFNARGVYQLSVHKYSQNRELFEGKAISLIENLDKYIVDTQQYRNFNLIESLGE